MTSHIPRQRDLHGVIPRQNLHVCAFLLVAERPRCKHALASGSADVGIIVARKVFHQEVDQSRVTLEGGQQCERVTARRRLGYHVGAQPVGQWHFRRRGQGQGLSLQEPVQLLGERSITQHAKESLQRESESHLCSFLAPSTWSMAAWYYNPSRSIYCSL